MNRIIKFRAWDKTYKHWYRASLKEDGWTTHDSTIEQSDGEVMEWQQFTGLLDKNGTEIYEGDVITFTEIDEDSCFGAEDTHTGVVRWIEEIAQWRFVYPSGQRTELHLIVQLPTIKKCEVVGNVWENPELLNTLKL